MWDHQFKMYLQFMHNVPSIPMKNNLGIGRNKNKLSKKLSILYCAIDDIWDRPSITIDESFAYMIIEALSYEEDDPEPQTIEEAMRRSDWSKWKTAIEKEYASLCKRKVFGPIVYTLTSRPVGYKMVLICKRDAQGQITRYKARLVA